MRIFIVAMPGCGNLGDDLISSILSKKIDSILKPAEIGILCGENNIADNYTDIKAKIIFFKRPRKIPLNIYFNSIKRTKDFVKSSDLLVIGGGGLFQDTHSPYTIHNYLKYLQYSNSKVMIVGIGAGPIKYKWNKIYLKKILNIDNLVIQVRDLESKELLRSIGVTNQILLGKDIVESSLIPMLENFKYDGNYHVQNILGVNIRKWHDINIKHFVSYLNQLVSKYKFTKISFFIFENGVNNNTEKKFALQIIAAIKAESNITTDLIAYNEVDNEIFYNKFFNVNYSIASRFHANILWQKAEIPTIPISYAPKVSSLYTKNDKPVLSFNQLIEQRPYDFTVIKGIKLDNSYLFPNLPEKSMIVNVKIKFQMKVLDFVGFFHNSFKSVMKRI